MKGIQVSLNQIKYKFYIPEDEMKINDIVIICNGVTTKYYEKTIIEVINNLVERNYLVVFFDYINTSKCKLIYKEKLCMYKFEEKLELIYSFLKDKYAKYNLNIFSSGFGAYVTLNSINDYNLQFDKIVFNTPAINMREIFKKKLAKECLIDFYRINPKKLDTDKMEQITDFYNELIEKDLFKNNKSFSNLYIIHDNRYNVVSLDENLTFINKCKNSKLVANINSYNELINNIIDIF